MSDRDTLTPEPEVPATPPAPEAEPAFLTRARRILAGDIRPEDYLPVTPEVQHRVKLFMDWAHARGNGVPLAPEVEPQQLRAELLSFHHGGENIVYIEDEHGIIVLAVGLDRGTDLFREFHGRTPHTLVDGVPFPRA